MLLLLPAIALAADCPPGQARDGDTCRVADAEPVPGAPAEVWTASRAALTGSDEVKRCLVPLAGREVEVDVSAEVRGGRAVGVVVSGPRRIPIEVQSCLAEQVARLALPAEPAEYRVEVPLVLAPER